MAEKQITYPIFVDDVYIGRWSPMAEFIVLSVDVIAGFIEANWHGKFAAGKTWKSNTAFYFNGLLDNYKEFNLDPT